MSALRFHLNNLAADDDRARGAGRRVMATSARVRLAGAVGLSDRSFCGRSFQDGRAEIGVAED